MNSDRNLYYRLLNFLTKQAYLIVIINVIIIVFLTLMPFNFAIPLSFSLDYIVKEFNQKTHINDFIANIIFFIPFGCGVASLIAQQKKQLLIFSNLIETCLISFCLSFFVENCQLFLVSREPNIFDLITNSFGGLLGGAFLIILKVFQASLANFCEYFNFWSLPAFKVKVWSILWLSYLIFISGLLINAQDASKLDNWSDKFPLVIGNEASGDRPWKGRISYLCLTNNSLPQTQINQLLKINNPCTALNTENNSNLIANYYFPHSQKYYPDLSKNNLRLTARRINPETKDFPGILTNKHNWLTSEIPAPTISNQIKKTSQFTLFTQLATNKLTQEGPARIISLSQNQFLRNLTIGQWHQDLSFRLRMPFTESNGKKPEIRLRKFFPDLNQQQLAITYDGVYLRFYSDRFSQVQSLYLGAETAIFWSIFSLISEKMYLNVGLEPINNLLYYSFIFAPLGIFWGLITQLLQTRVSGFLILITGGILIPPLLIEGIISSTSDRSWSWQYLSLGLGVLIISFAIAFWLRTKKMTN